jgi:hypothetical protein
VSGAYYNHEPTGGKQCYASLSINNRKELTIGNGRFHAYYVDVTSGLDYSNVDVRVLIEVWSGEVTTTLSLTPDWILLLPPPTSVTAQEDTDQPSPTLPFAVGSAEAYDEFLRCFKNEIWQMP